MEFDDAPSLRLFNAIKTAITRDACLESVMCFKIEYSIQKGSDVSEPSGSESYERRGYVQLGGFWEGVGRCKPPPLNGVC